MPDGGRADFKGVKIFQVQWRKKSIGIDPDAQALDEDMAVHGKIRVKVCAQHAIILGIDAAEVHADARHATDAVGQQEQRGGWRKAAGGDEREGFGRQKTDGGGNFLRRRRITFEGQFGIGGIAARGKSGDEIFAVGNRLDMKAGRVPASGVSDKVARKGATSSMSSQ